MGLGCVANGLPKREEVEGGQRQLDSKSLNL